MRRLLLLLTPLLALLLGLAACSGDDGGGATTAAEEQGTTTASPQQVVLAAARATTDAGSYRSTFELEFRGLADEPVSMRGEGIFSSKPTRGRMTFDMSALGGVAGQDLGEADFIFDGDVLYMRFPALASRSPELKEWIRFDLRDLAGPFGDDLGQLSQINQSDPAAALEYLRAASDDVEEVGDDDVRGEPTTHYRMTVDLAKVGELSRAQRANVRKLLDEAGIREVPAEVWVDEQDRVRRLTLAYENMRTKGGPELDMTMKMELYDFGVDFSVTPPPPGKVTDLGDVIGRGAEETEHSEPEGS